MPVWEPTIEVTSNAGGAKVTLLASLVELVRPSITRFGATDIKGKGFWYCVLESVTEVNAMLANARDPARQKLLRQEAAAYDAIRLLADLRSYRQHNWDELNDEQKATLTYLSKRSGLPTGTRSVSTHIHRLGSIRRDLAEPRDGEGRTRDECIASVGDKWTVSDTAQLPRRDERYWAGGCRAKEPMRCCQDHIHALDAPRFILTRKTSPELVKLREQRDVLAEFVAAVIQNEGEKSDGRLHPHISHCWDVGLNYISSDYARCEDRKWYYDSTCIVAELANLDAKIKQEESK